MNSELKDFATGEGIDRSAAPGVLLTGLGAALLARLVFRPKPVQFKQAVVAITGGSRGLGLELARLFAAEGARLILIARNSDELFRAAGELQASGAEVRTISADVAHPASFEGLAAEILGAWGRVDVLINNAGVIQFGPLENMDPADFEEAMDIHAWGPLRLIRAMVPSMRRQGGGRIVNIASIGGLVAIPHLVPYSMSKFALVGLSDGLRNELAPQGIRVTTIAPGLMRTGSHLHAQMKGQYRREFLWFALGNALPITSMDSRRAASKILKACRAGKARVILSWQARLLYLLNAVFPGPLSWGMKQVVRAMPRPGLGTEEGNRKHPGYRSASRRLGWFTLLADRAARRNNESRAA